MPDLLSKLDREQLVRLEDKIERWQAALHEDLATSSVESGATEHPIDPAYVERFVETAQRLSSQVHKEVPPDLDPEALAEIRGHLIDGLRLSTSSTRSGRWTVSMPSSSMLRR